MVGHVETSQMMTSYDVINGGLWRLEPTSFPGHSVRGETPSQILPDIIFSLYSRIPREYKYTQLLCV